MVGGFFTAVVQLLTLLDRVLDAFHLGLTIAIGYHYLVVGFGNKDALQVVAGYAY